MKLEGEERGGGGEGRNEGWGGKKGMGREGRGGEEIRKCNDSKSVLIKYTSEADADPPLYVASKRETGRSVIP